MSCAQHDEFCIDEDDMTMINALDPDKLAANKSASAHDTLKKSISHEQQFTKKSGTAQSDVSHEGG